MDVITLALDKLVPAEKNVRIHNERQVLEIAKSVKQFGQFRPIVVDENNVILAGNGLYMGMKHLGLTEAKVVQYTTLTENQKKKLMLSDNKVFSIGSDNFEVIDEFLQSLDGDFDIAGFDAKMLEDVFFPSAETLSDEDDEELEEMKQQGEKFDRGEVVVSTAIVEQKKDSQVRKYIVCPHCGEKIYTD